MSSPMVSVTTGTSKSTPAVQSSRFDEPTPRNGGGETIFPLCTSRIARHTSWAEICLSRNPRAPESVAFFTYALSLCAESMMTLALGTAFITWRVASRPFDNGIAMSIKTTSG